MSVGAPSVSLNTSAASSQVDTREDIMENTQLKNYVKDLLKSRIFLGRYLERRLTDQRIGYRDIVLISPAEVELKRDLVEAHHKLRLAFPNIHWIGVTDGEQIGYPSSVCIWTEIDNQPFGPFWFQIRSIKYREDEVIVILKSLRHISDAFLEIEPVLTGSTKNLYNTTVNQPDSSVATLNETYNEIISTLKGALSIRNLKEFVTFLVAFVIAVFTGGNAFINFLGNFILALIREVSVLVKNSTPMFLGFLDFMSKIVGGFYILVAMFFKPSNPVPQNRRAFTDRYPRRTSIEYDERCFD